MFNSRFVDPCNIAVGCSESCTRRLIFRLSSQHPPIVLPGGLSLSDVMNVVLSPKCFFKWAGFCTGGPRLCLQNMQVWHAHVPQKAHLRPRPLPPGHDLRVHGQVPGVADCPEACAEAGEDGRQQRADGLEHDLQRRLRAAPVWATGVNAAEAEGRPGGADAEGHDLLRRLLGQVEVHGAPAADGAPKPQQRGQVRGRHHVQCRLLQQRAATKERGRQARV